MKKWLLFALCALLLLAAPALAQEEPVYESGNLTYEMFNDRTICIVGAVADENGWVFIPPELDGYEVDAMEMDALDENVSVLVKPWTVGEFDREKEGDLSLRIIDYWSWKRVQGESHYASQLPDMTRDQIALSNVEEYSYINGVEHKRDVTIYASEIPDTIGGYTVLTKLLDQDVIYENVDWNYVRAYDGQSVEIIGSDLPADLETLIVPLELDGLPVRGLSLDAIPTSVKMVYHPDICYFMIHNLKNPAPRDFDSISYMTYDQVQQQSYMAERLMDMTEDQLALYFLSHYTYQSGSMNSSSANTHVMADELPSMIDGHPVINGMNEDSVYYVSGDWTYSYDYDRTSVRAVDCALPEGTELLVIPAQIDGLPVRSWNMMLASKHDLSVVLHPYNTYCFDQDHQNLSFDTFTYIDQQMLPYTDEYHRERYGDLKDDQILLKDYIRYVDGKRADKETIEYADIPTEINGKEVLIDFQLKDNVTIHKYKDYSYVLQSDGTIALIRYENEFNQTVIVPNRMDGYTVTAIMGDGWDYTFNSQELKELQLPSTLRKMGDHSLNTYALQTIELPEGLEEIGKEAFSSLNSLKTLKLPNSLKKLGSRWLQYSGYKLKNLTIPASVTTLEKECFSQSQLTKLVIPDTVVSIGEGAFSKMNRLSSLTLPSNMTEIPAQLAAASEKLAKISIPASVEVIGKQAFASCSKLASITFAKKNAQIREIGEGAFTSTALAKISLPEGVESIGKEAFLGCSKATSVSLPSTMKYIGDYAFSGCSGITKITLPEGVTAISEGLFSGCKKLSSITIPASVTEIEDFAFDGCSSKLSLTVTEGSYAHQWAEENGMTFKFPGKKKK